MTEQTPSIAIRPRIVCRYFLGMTSHIELECGHHKDERSPWSGYQVKPGEVARCWECGQVAAGLMPSAEQLAAFRREHQAAE